MSHELFSRNPDLKRLRDEGYFVEVRGALLLMREVPYVDASKHVCRGTIVSGLTMAGNVTQKPDSHQVWFDGEFPCNADGTALKGIGNASGSYDLGSGVIAKHHFSSKPRPEGYTDHYEKMVTYAGVIAGPAAVLGPGANPRFFRTPEEQDDGVFNYLDTASARVGIGALSDKLAKETVSIVGLGGSGSYVLDMVAKTPVKEIRLFDNDKFLSHNAFRAPGAASIEELREVHAKVEYFRRAYSRMHRRIVAHRTFIRADNVQLLDGTTFAFLCMDAGEDKRAVVRRLEEIGAGFVDVGMGLDLDDAGTLGGMLRVTASTPEKRDHVHSGRVPFAGGGADDVYASNIQVAELNALTAALAVLKWKKDRGFYRDAEREHHSTYTTESNLLINGDRP
ncbi:ThiF family adenylyltransferase [Zavarzinella formosa]|uniref:ThiF family adenylyltransferase n=1 Tax=Zavarzinella formosa TaxID=360055 RepID=UPI00036524BD|nr:ThiF family adenylyltransferase [Zavarzinella formosa]